MKYILSAVVVLAIAGGVYWYGMRAGWFDASIPSHPPTADERRRMEEIDRTSSEIAPDAVPGATVRMKGSLPPSPVTPPDTSPDATSSEATSTPISE